MAGMWIVQIDVTDPDGYAKYIEGSTAVVAKHEGRFIARGGRYEQPEGRGYPRNVVITFPTYEKAVDAYESEEYQAILGLATNASERRLTILEVDD